MADKDATYMALALEQAGLAESMGEVPVGAIIVDPDTDEIIAAAHNHPIDAHDPTAHAEIEVIRQAADKVGNYRLSGLTLYVTLEPCAMCAGAISHARIGRLVYGAHDAKGGAIAHGPKFFNSPTCHHRPDVLGGVMDTQSADMLKAFFKARRAK